MDGAASLKSGSVFSNMIQASWVQNPSEIMGWKELIIRGMIRLKDGGSETTDFGTSEIRGVLSASFSFLEERHDVFMALPFSNPRRATNEPPCLA